MKYRLVTIEVQKENSFFEAKLQYNRNVFPMLRLVYEIIDAGRNSQLTPEAIDLYDDKASSLDMFSLISDPNNGP